MYGLILITLLFGIPCIYILYLINKKTIKKVQPEEHDYKVLIYRAEENMEQGQIDEAIKYLEVAVSKNPLETILLHKLARMKNARDLFESIPITKRIFYSTLLWINLIFVISTTAFIAFELTPKDTLPNSIFVVFSFILFWSITIAAAIGYIFPLLWLSSLRFICRLSDPSGAEIQAKRSIKHYPNNSYYYWLRGILFKGVDA